MNIIQTYLPNFKYKDDKIFFIFKNPIKLDIMKKIVWMNEIDLPNIRLFNKVEYEYDDIEYKIINEECFNGLKINIYEHYHNEILLDKIPDIIKHIEAQLLSFDVKEISNPYTTISKKVEISNDDGFSVYTKRKSPTYFNKSSSFDRYSDDESF
jgi:hypothetical protein